jgi:hypothetical protein
MSHNNILIASDAGLAVRSYDDIAEFMGACIGTDGLLLTEGDLSATFFDLKSRLAGELLQKFVNYGVRVAIVVPDPAAHGERFRELAYEHRTHPLIRFVRSHEAAMSWLAAPGTSPITHD